MKHRASLNTRTRKLEGKESAHTQCERTPPRYCDLLSLPEMPSVPTGPDDGNLDMFKSLRRFGLSYLDENGEQLEFSAGTGSDDNNGRWTQNEEAESIASECSDSESDIIGPNLEWTVLNGGLTDYWPYPSKTVGGDSRFAC